MMRENETFEQIDFLRADLDTDYVQCTFVGCSFAQLLLIDTFFEDCVFQNCDFSMTDFKNSMRDVTFRDCKLVGANFAELNGVSGGFVFQDTRMDYAVLVGVRLHKARFENCILHETGLDQAELKEAVFDRCDLSGATFNGANLEKTDFSTAYNYTLIPENCKLKKTVFSEYGLKGLVAHLNIIVR